MAEQPTSNQRGLGRGLGALIVSTEAYDPAVSAASQADAGGVRMIGIGDILPNPHQPRSTFDPALLAELAASIRSHGIIQPLIVTVSSERGDRFWLVAGERRLRAAQLAELAQVPAIVREASPQQLMEWALVENVQRADLNPLEEASAYRALMQEHGLTQAEVADRVGKSRSAVANTVRLLQLPASIQQAVLADRISAGHARALLALEDETAMTVCLQKIVDRDLNVRQTEQLVKSMQAQPDEGGEQEPLIDPSEEALAAHYRSLEGRFRNSLGTRVNLSRNPDGSGRLVIHFYGDDDLQLLYERFIVEAET